MIAIPITRIASSLDMSAQDQCTTTIDSRSSIVILKSPAFTNSSTVDDAMDEDSTTSVSTKNSVATPPNDDAQEVTPPNNQNHTEAKSDHEMLPKSSRTNVLTNFVRDMKEKRRLRSTTGRVQPIKKAAVPKKIERGQQVDTWLMQLSRTPEYQVYAYGSFM